MSRYALMLLTLFGLPLIFSAQPEPSPITPANAAELTLSATFTGHDRAVNDVAFTPDSSLLLSASDDLSLRFWDVRNGELRGELYGQMHQVRAVDVSLGGETAITAGFNGSAYLWDVRSFTRAQSVTVDGFPAVSDAEFAPNGAAFALAAADGTVRTYDAETHEPLQILTTDNLLVERIAYHPEGTAIAAGLGFPADAARVWSLETGDLLYTLEAGTGTVYGVDWSPDGATIVTGGGDGVLRLWDAETGELLADIAAGEAEIFDVRYHPNGALIVSGGFDGVLRLWDAETLDLLAEYRPTDAPRSLLAVAFNPDGTLLAAAGETGDVWVWSNGGA